MLWQKGEIMKRYVSAVRSGRGFVRFVAGLLCLIPLAGSAASVIEFYNTTLDNYFVTADPIEAAAIDSGSAGPGWIRTGGSFDSGGTDPVCRFYGSISPGPNSHFYSVLAAECAALKQLQLTTPATQKRWNFESLDFVTGIPSANGTCAAGKVPVYRAYNDGFPRGVDSNHRITTSAGAIQQVVARGWKNEGVVMCAPGPLAAASCAALRSGNYQIVTPTANASVRVMTAVLDASTMVMRLADGRSITWSSEGPCRFVQAGINRFAVAPSGAAVWTSALFGTGMKMSLMLPEQTVQPGELQGVWNTLNMQSDSGPPPYGIASLMVIISGSGSITAASKCVLMTPCTALPGPFPTLIKHAAGGFTIAGEPDLRVFAFRAESGDLVFTWVDNDGLIVGTRARTLAAPVPGTVSSFASVNYSATGIAGNFSDGGFVIGTVDSATNSYTRTSTIDGHVETVRYNTPRDGLSYRPAGTASTTSGGTVNVSESYLLGLPGMGLSIFARPTTGSVAAFFGFSVTAP